jgi:hypothetical protein
MSKKKHEPEFPAPALVPSPSEEMTPVETFRQPVPTKTKNQEYLCPVCMKLIEGGGVVCPRDGERVG